MDEKGPKSNKPLIKKEEVSAQLAIDEFVSSQHLLFTALERTNPQVAESLQSAFDEFLETQIQMFREDPTGNFSIEDVKKRIPNNKWIEAVADVSKTELKKSIN